MGEIHVLVSFRASELRTSMLLVKKKSSDPWLRDSEDIVVSETK